MFESFLVTFRESLEAALIVGVVMAFLKRNQKTSATPLVLTAIAAALGFSFFGAYLFSFAEDGFTGIREQVFEGTVMWIAAGLLTYMIVWLYRQKNLRHKLEQKLMSHSDEIKKVGLFSLVFFAVLREGVETILFLSALRYSSGHLALWGAFFGFFAAVVTGYMLFVLEIKLPMKRFFQLSGALLIFFAAGLFSGGFHEFQEAGFLGQDPDSLLVQPIVYLAYFSIAFFLFFKSKKVALDITSNPK